MDAWTFNDITMSQQKYSDGGVGVIEWVFWYSLSIWKGHCTCVALLNVKATNRKGFLISLPDSVIFSIAGIVNKFQFLHKSRPTSVQTSFLGVGASQSVLQFHNLWRMMFWMCTVLFSFNVFRWSTSWMLSAILVAARTLYLSLLKAGVKEMRLLHRLNYCSQFCGC